MITTYDIEYMGVLCTGVEWIGNGKNIFHLLKDDKEYTFDQKYAICCSADTDHIRAIIEYQFLPWWKEQYIKKLESENAELRKRLKNKERRNDNKI